MNKPEIDYRHQFVPESTSHLTAERASQLRAKLVERLAQGIEVSFPDGTLLFFKSRVITAQDRDIVRVDIENVAWISVDIKHDSTAVALNLRKYYVDFVEEGSHQQPKKEVSVQLKKRGLISVLSALLFQVLIEKGVEVVQGEIESNNAASFLARCNTPDFITGGFFATRFTKRPQTWRSQGKQFYLAETPLRGERRQNKVSSEDIAKLLV